ncbi:MAG: hypothetical protein D6732_13945 [Methanobacteriota archaeon]|nr:MAG: hypothetical protein D6732_13945 [Euryarchaeota archaeon]
MSIYTLPYPALEILKLLAKHGSLTAKEIQDYLGPEIEQKAIKYALRRLLENKVIYRVPNLLDMRSVYYRTATREELSELANDLSPEVTEQIIRAMEQGNDNFLQT